MPYIKTRKAYREANREKIAEYDKAYREANKEKIKAYREANKKKAKVVRKEYAEANKEKIKASLKAYYEANKEKIKVRDKSYHEANKEKVLLVAKAYREANKEKIREKIRDWYKSNKAKAYAYCVKRRALKMNQYEKLSADDKFVIEECYELSQLRTKRMGFVWHVDHIIPLSKGGLHKPTNLQVVPGTWNLQKNNNHQEKWIGKD